MFLLRRTNYSNYINHVKKISLFTVVKHLPCKTINRQRGTSRYACRNASITLETAVVLPFFACFMVFILYFFRIMQVQTAVALALQYTGRMIAAECSTQLKTDAVNSQEEQKDLTISGSDFATLAKAKVKFSSELSKLNCPFGFVNGGLSGISLAQSDVSGNYIELKAEYRMKLPVGLVGDISYHITQEIKCHKWTGYKPGENSNEDDTWLYYTEYGTVYHASRGCAYLDLSIRGISVAQVNQSRNQSGGIYHKCEICGNQSGGGMVYITTYGNRYHTTLTCSGLKRSIYMIRRSEANGKPICKKCGGN